MANLRVDKITSTETFETTGSVEFDRAGDYLTTDLGSGLGDNFTIEFWILAKGIVSGTNSPGMFQLSDTSGGFKQSTSSLAMYWSTTHDMLGIYHQGESNRTSADPNENNIWKHYAMVRNNGIIKVYRNGKEVYTDISTTNYSGYRYLVIGGYWSTSYLWKGHISNFRILNNKALYTSNFKSPMRELEVTPETVLLACQSKTDTILEKTGKTITRFGSTIANELTPGLLTPVPKSGGGSAITGSVEFSGGTASNPGDSLSVPNTTDLRLGSSDFTVEAYVNFTNGAVSNGVIVALWDNTDNRRSWNFYFDTSNGLYFAGSTNGSSGNNNVNASIDIEDGEWYHVAACRSGSTIRLFVNGIERASNTSVGTYYENTVDPIRIGAQNNDDPTNFWKGFISNLRIVKGTALYTDDFIPPTRELKKVPGTVLLCCQDPDNPLTEATGKTITGYGNLSPGGGSNLISNAYDAYAPGDTTGWSTDQGASLSVSSGRLRVTNGTSDYGIAQTSITTITGQRYLVTADFHAGTGQIGELRASNTSFSNTLGSSNQGHNATGPKSLIFTAASTTTYINVFGSNNNGQYTEWANFSVTLAEGSNKGSNFTPQVGDDRKVTFEGVTKINSENYFYLPTGDTASRETTGTYNAGTRAVYHSAQNPDTATYDTLEYLNIATLGSVKNFGDLNNEKQNQVACSSNTRGLFASGYTPSPASGNNFIDYVTIMSTGDALDFGELSYITYVPDALSNQIRGIWGGGAAAPNYSGQDDISYVTIASKGNGTDFGNLTDARHSLTGLASPTRGIFGAGQTNVNTMDYITIASTGNAQDFGDLLLGRAGCAGASSSIRGLFAGGYTATPNVNNIIEFITIASMGNSQDFGDLTAVRRFAGATSSSIRGVFIAGFNPSATNTIDYVSIQTTGNAVDFGETINKTQSSACSNGHGGLG